MDRIVAFIDSLGYLRCGACNGSRDGIPVYSDTAPHNVEPCDFCGAVGSVEPKIRNIVIAVPEALVEQFVSYMDERAIVAEMRRAEMRLSYAVDDALSGYSSDKGRTFPSY